MATSAQSDGFTFCAYAGDGAVLLAFDLDESRQADLAGFAVEYTDPDGKTFPVLNRLSFAQAITSATTPEQRQFTPTDDESASHWLDLAAPVAQRRIDSRIAAAARAIRDDPAATILSRELALNAGLSESRFLHLFRDEFGTSTRDLAEQADRMILATYVEPSPTESPLVSSP